MNRATACRTLRGAMLLAGLIAGAGAQAQDSGKILAALKAPPGFKITVYAESVPGARSMARSENGTLFVGTRPQGKVYAIRELADGRRQVLTIAQGLNMPNGVALRDGALYVAEVQRILRYDGIEGRLDAPPKPVVVRSDLPTDRHHGWRYIAFGPDGKLYVPIGAPCNVCDQKGYASITRMNPDGSGREVVATGVRNTVGMTWQPGTNDLWFTDNGRDYLGEDVPPDELNHAAKAGLNFGFPFCHAGEIKDPEFGNLGDCKNSTPPARKLGAHVAAIGVKFYTGAEFPETYRNQVFIAEHGSWNRKERSGYRISLVRVEGDKAVSYEPFITGWNQPNEVLGRPVDLLVLPDGSMLISDDQAGLIYQVSYSAG
ncbi:MAG TPA: sorbosone dehydrogenase family protein [Steroidobacteraceae bacterium]|nr:sorbosone dehydrogenase family protein [Steroidobacteraceae bacterium]